MALPPNNNYLYGNTNLPYENNNQIAFAPDSKKDKTIKTLYENKDMYGDTPAYKQLRERDVEQFNKGKEPLSLPAEEYKGIKGYTANAAGYPRATMTDANNIFNTGQRTTPNSSAINFGNAFNYFNEDFFNQPNTGITGAKMNLEEEFNPTQYSALQDIANRNKGVPQDSRFSGIMRNVARGPLFQGGAFAGNAVGNALGMTNPLFAVAGAIGSQFLPLNNRPSDLDYNYINNPNMGGLSLQGNKIQDPTGILQGKNFASGFGSNSLAEMYDKALGKNQSYLDKNELSLNDLGGIGDLTEEELAALGLTTKELAKRNTLLDRRGVLTNRRGTITNRRGDFIYGGEMIPGTGKTRNQFADEYNKAQDNIGSNYDQLDTQSYSGSTASGGLGGGMDTTTGNYDDPYSPGDTE